VARSGTAGTAAVSTGTSTTAVASTGCATGTVRIVDSGGGSMPPTRVDVEEGKEAEEEEEGRDTHYVSFEGDLSRVVVIDKGAYLSRWLMGSAEASKRYDEVWAACQLTPICMVLNLVSIAATMAAYTCIIHDKRLFLIPGIAGVGNWYNMLTSRSPRVLRILAMDFDVLFNFGNLAVWA